MRPVIGSILQRVISAPRRIAEEIHHIRSKIRIVSRNGQLLIGHMFLQIMELLLNSIDLLSWSLTSIFSARPNRWIDL